MLVVILLVFSCLALTSGVVGIWARRNVVSTDRFVHRAEQVIDQPEVQEAVADRLTVQLMLLVDPRALFEEVLPERGQALALPLSRAVQDFVHDRALGFVASDRFAEVWTSAVRVAHRAALRVLRSEGELPTARNGEVTLNLLPAVIEVLRQIGDASPQLVGGAAELSSASADDIPQSVITRIESATGIDLDDDFGQITVYEDTRLEGVQQAIRWIDRLIVMLIPVGLVLAGVALWLSNRRRRTLLQLCVGLALGMVLIRRAAFTVEDEVAGIPPTESGGRAVAATAGVFLDPLTTFAAWMLLAVAIVAAVAVFAADYPWAVSTRTAVRDHVARTAPTSGTQSTDVATVSWIRHHPELLMLGGCLVGFLILWVADLGWFGMLAVLGLVAAFVLIVQRLSSAPTGPTHAA